MTRLLMKILKPINQMKANTMFSKKKFTAKANQNIKANNLILKIKLFNHNNNKFKQNKNKRNIKKMQDTMNTILVISLMINIKYFYNFLLIYIN